MAMARYAQEFSRALGRTIQYVNVPPQVWEAKLHEAQLPAHLIAHLITMGLRRVAHDAGFSDRAAFT